MRVRSAKLLVAVHLMRSFLLSRAQINNDCDNSSVSAVARAADYGAAVLWCVWLRYA